PTVFYRKAIRVDDPMVRECAMPVVALANPKGGSGKSTCCLLLATELAKRGATVTIIDADPERWISQWGTLEGRPSTLRIRNDVTEDTIVSRIEEAAASSSFVIVDLEGTASLLVARAIAVADLVLIPIQGSSMDAKGGAKLIRLIRAQAKQEARTIDYAVVLTRTSAAVVSRSLRYVMDEMRTGGIDVLVTPIVERAAFRELFDYGGTLDTLDAGQVSNLPRAIENASQFAGEVVGRLKDRSKRDVA
ncbi:MAG: ParA family protein, partial [Pseudomonadota bacterium]